RRGAAPRAGGPRPPPPPAGPLDRRGDVFELAVGRVWLGIAAVTASAPVVVVNREVLGQQGGQRRLGSAVGRPGPYQQDRRAGTEPVIGDARAVGGDDVVHDDFPGSDRFRAV